MTPTDIQRCIDTIADHFKPNFNSGLIETHRASFYVVIAGTMSPPAQIRWSYALSDIREWFSTMAAILTDDIEILASSGATLRLDLQGNKIGHTDTALIVSKTSSVPNDIYHVSYHPADTDMGGIVGMIEANGARVMRHISAYGAHARCLEPEDFLFKQVYSIHHGCIIRSVDKSGQGAPAWPVCSVTVKE